MVKLKVTIIKLINEWIFYGKKIYEKVIMVKINMNEILWFFKKIKMFMAKLTMAKL